MSIMLHDLLDSFLPNCIGCYIFASRMKRAGYNMSEEGIKWIIRHYDHSDPRCRKYSQEKKLEVQESTK